MKLSRSQSKLLDQAVNTFNHKVAYHASKGSEGLPDRASVRTLKSQINSVADLNREVASLKRFGTRGSEKAVTVGKGVKISKWQKQEVGIKVATINRERTKRRKEIEKIEVTSQGKKTGMKRGEMGSERSNGLKPKKLNWDSFRNKREISIYKESVDKLVSTEYRVITNENFKENYIQSLKTIFGADAKDVISVVDAMPADELVDKMFQEQEITVEFQYDKLDVGAKLNAVRAAWGIEVQTE